MLMLTLSPTNTPTPSHSSTSRCPLPVPSGSAGVAVQLSLIRPKPSCMQLLEKEFEAPVADDVVVFSCIFLLLTFNRSCSIYVCGRTLLLALELRDSANEALALSSAGLFPLNLYENHGRSREICGSMLLHVGPNLKGYSSFVCPVRLTLCKPCLLDVPQTPCMINKYACV